MFLDDRVISELQRAMSGGQNRTMVAQRLADIVRSQGQFRWVGLYDVDASARLVRNVAWSGPGAPAHPVFSTDRGLTAAALSGRATVNVGDVTEDRRYLTAFASTRSELIVPVLDRAGEPVGTLDVESDRLHAFTAEIQAGLEQCVATIRGLWIDVREAPPLRGAIVAGEAARWPDRTTLEGRIVRLDPLAPARHGASLYEGSHGTQNEAVWTYLFDGPYATYDAFLLELEQKANSLDRLFYAIVDRASGNALGYASYMRLEPAHRVIEVGNILYAPNLQGTTGATEAMFLMARYAFEVLGYRRYEWKCDALNSASRRAALRLGFTFEGVFRQHMIVKDRNRDTAWYSMLDTEWPVCKLAFERWLDPSNFDEMGQQRTSLSAMRAVPLT